ncbi:MAG: hypothetical protein PSV26_02885 [Polaromonas sp.]|uniref:hypothetical protein n=1 Tax=Polaromonas sp. TaxID=1869339 RepID=UPI002488393E|nr:hypothetical protein [Polaromonas sp.]MDI1236411.1 hypothetical protein [Polaromonas sp.]
MQTPNSGSVNALRASAALYAVLVSIEESAAHAAYALGLHRSTDTADAAKKIALAASPRFVETIELRGSVTLNMYEEHPGHTYFQSPAARRFETTGYMTLSAGMQLGLAILAEVNAEYEQDEEFEGQFSASTVVLKDQFGATIQRGRVVGRGTVKWASLIGADLWTQHLDQAEKLLTEAGIESGWDNFATSASLSDSAREIQDRVSLSMNSRLVVH